MEKKFRNSIKKILFVLKFSKIVYFYSIEMMQHHRCFFQAFQTWALAVLAWLVTESGTIVNKYLFWGTYSCTQIGQSSFFVLSIYCLGGYKKWFTYSCTQIGLNPNYLFRPIWVQEKVYLLLYPNWSERKMFSEKCIVMIMRHKGG